MNRTGTARTPEARRRLATEVGTYRASLRAGASLFARAIDPARRRLRRRSAALALHDQPERKLIQDESLLTLPNWSSALQAQAGWLLQDRDEMNLAAGSAIPVREFKLAKDHGYVDYLLFLDGCARTVQTAQPFLTGMSTVIQTAP